MEGYTIENENFTRLQLLLMKCGTPVAVELLTDRKNALSPPNHLPDPWTLHEFLKDKESIITNRIKTQLVMKQKSIVEKLFPKDQCDLNPNKWDLPLLIFVITTCCQMPPTNFIVQHLYKMKEVRNVLCHSCQPSISKDEYETMSDRVHGAIKEIMNFIGDNSLRKRIKEEMRKYKHDAIGSLAAFQTSLDEWFDHESLQIDILMEVKEEFAKVGENVSQVGENVTEVDKKVSQVVENVTQVDEKVSQIGEKVSLVSDDVQTIINLLKIVVCRTHVGRRIPIPVTRALMMDISRTEEPKEAAEHFISAFLSHTSKKVLAQAIHDAMAGILGSNECVGLEQKCVLFEIRCPSLEAFVSLLEDCASGKLTTYVKPVEKEMRKEDRWKNIELDVTLNETELKKTIDDIVTEVANIRMEDELAKLENTDDESLSETTDTTTESSDEWRTQEQKQLAWKEIFTSSDTDRRQLKNKIIIAYGLHDDVDEVKIKGALNSNSIEKIETDDEYNLTVIELKDSNEAMKILQNRPFLIDETEVRVEMFVPQPSYTVVVDFGTHDSEDPESTLNDLIVYFENGNVSEKTSWYDPGLDKFFVTMDDSDDVANAVFKREHTINGRLATVNQFKYTLKKHRGDVEDEILSGYVVKVAGVKTVDSLEMLKLYLEDKDLSGGGEILDVETSSENEDVIYITFAKEDDAKEVASKSHDVAYSKLSISLHRVYKDKLLIKGLPSMKNLEKNLGIYLKAVGKCVVVKGSLVMHCEHRDVGMVTTEKEIDLGGLKEKCKKKPMEKKNLRLSNVPMTKTVLVTTKSEWGVRRILKNKPFSLGGHIDTISVYSDICAVAFKDYGSVDIVLKRGLKWGKQQLRVTRYFECIGKGEDGTVLPTPTESVMEKSSFVPPTSIVLRSDQPESASVGLDSHWRTKFNGTHIFAGHGNITTLSVDVIVNPSDSRLTMLGQLGKEIEKLGGRDIVKECKFRLQEGTMTPTEVFISNGGKLKAAKIAHIVTPHWEDTKGDERSVLTEIVMNVLFEASKTSQTVAFPAVGCGVGKFPGDIATEIIVSAARKYLQENTETPLTHIYFCDKNQETVRHFTNAVQKEFSERKVETKDTGQHRFVRTIPDMTQGVALELPLSHTYPSRPKRPLKDFLTRIERPASLQSGSKVCSSTTIGDITINLVKDDITNFKALKILITQSLVRANLSYQSIAFPAIGTGTQGFPNDVVAREMFAAVESFVQDNPEPVLNMVSFVILPSDKDTFQAFETEMLKRQEQKRT